MALTFSSVTNPAYANAENSFIDCVVMFDGFATEVEFTASASDVEGHSREIFARAVAGDFGPVAPYVEPSPPVPESVTPAQAKIALFEAGLLDGVEALVAAYPYKPVQIWWGNATQFEITNGYLQALGFELGLSGDQIADLFIAAGKK